MCSGQEPYQTTEVWCRLSNVALSYKWCLARLLTTLGKKDCLIFCSGSVSHSLRITALERKVTILLLHDFIHRISLFHNACFALVSLNATFSCSLAHWGVTTAGISVCLTLHIFILIETDTFTAKRHEALAHECTNWMVSFNAL
uniref:Uncharacterized protein n=1 Tax=Amphilophus citrinellus TaxID=61819 RepID=A0A3Q0SJS1_AMPCI